MSDAPHLILQTSVGSEADAQRLARLAIENRLAACVQIEPMQSIYSWQGEVQQEREWRLGFKTTSERLADLLAALKPAHPYELPAFYTVSATPLTPEWRQWVESGVGDAEA